MTVDSAAPTGSTRRRAAGRLASLLGSLIGLAGLAFVVRILVREWPEVRSSLSDADVALLALAVVLSGLGMGWVGLQWSAVVRSLGGPVVRTSYLMRSYFIGQMGKYVPGGIWPVLGRAELLTRAQVPRSVAYPSVGLSMVTTYVAALIVTAVTAPWALWKLDLHHGWVVAIAPLGLLALHPRLLRRVVALGERVFSRGGGIRVPPWRESVGLVVRHVPAWVLIAMSTWLTARAIGADIGFVALAYATPLSWAAGLAAVPVPGGIGVREAVFVALLAGAADDATIATVAILSRLAFVVSDVLTAVLAGSLVARPRAVVPSG